MKKIIFVFITILLLVIMLGSFNAASIKTEAITSKTEATTSKTEANTFKTEAASFMSETAIEAYIDSFCDETKCSSVRGYYLLNL